MNTFNLMSSNMREPGGYTPEPIFNRGGPGMRLENKQREGSLNADETAELAAFKEFTNFNQSEQRGLAKAEQLGTLTENGREGLQIYRRAKAEKRMPNNEEYERLSLLREQDTQPWESIQS